MKNPNGYGSITRIKRKNLRKPHRVRVTLETTTDENGKKHQRKKCIGYFETKEIEELSVSRHKGYASTIYVIPDNLKNAKFITLRYQ